MTSLYMQDMFFFLGTGRMLPNIITLMKVQGQEVRRDKMKQRHLGVQKQERAELGRELRRRHNNDNDEYKYHN